MAGMLKKMVLYGGTFIVCIVFFYIGMLRGVVNKRSMPAQEAVSTSVSTLPLSSVLDYHIPVLKETVTDRERNRSMSDLNPDIDSMQQYKVLLKRNNIQFQGQESQVSRSKSNSFLDVDYEGRLKNDISKVGYVVAIDFWDQQTFSIQNILGLQGWAAWLGVHTVEPFLIGTKFQIPLGKEEAFYDRNGGHVSYLRMGDVYDIEQWNNETANLRFKVAPLSSWNDFLTTASRNVVYIKFEMAGDCTDLNKEVNLCNRTLNKIGFNIQSARCVYPTRQKHFTVEDFKTQIYGHNYTPSEVTVIFNYWSQRNIPRLPGMEIFKSSNTVMDGGIKVSLKPSRKILSDATHYQVNNYLPSNGSYVGILVRMEWLVMNSALNRRRYLLRDCLNRSIGWVSAVTNQRRVYHKFIGMDIGKYGSSTLGRLNEDYTMELGEYFLQNIYGTQSGITLESWENTFANVSSSQEAGYVAFLQKTLAVSGDCLILIGFGSFQSHALHTYLHKHNPHDYCYLKTDSQCRIKSMAGFKIL